MQISIRNQRASIGLIQGLALYLLDLASSYHVWPATTAAIFIPCLLIAIYIPIIISTSITILPRKILYRWALFAIILLIVLGVYDGWLNTYPLLAPSNSPSFRLFFGLTIGLFIAHALVISGAIDQRIIAHYPTYFDVAWKMVVQLVLISLFLMIFWGLLSLCAVLFSIIKLNFLSYLIKQAWFNLPVTTLMINVGIHTTDVSPTLVRGMRTLILVMLSWLLPILTIIMTGFLISLIFMGSAPLEKLQGTALILLFSIIFWLIVLINAAYQNGQSIPSILRYSCIMANLVLLPISILTGYILYQNVITNSWTIINIINVAAIIIAIFYAIGYARAATQLKRIERWNFFAAILILLVLISLLTPVADPERLYVANQLTRLKSGAIAPQIFDFDALLKNGDRYGYEALVNLKNDANNSAIATAASIALAKQPITAKTASNQPSLPLIIAHTPNGQLPTSFTQQNWTQYNPFQTGLNPIPGCVSGYGNRTCDAWVTVINKINTVIIVEKGEIKISVFQQMSPEKWRYIGYYEIPSYSCDDLKNQATKGQFKLVPPAPSTMPDFEINNKKLPFKPISATECTP